MKAPRKVTVSPYQYAVRFDRRAMAAASANGVCMEDTTTILLAPGNAKMVERETLLHECLHAIWGQTPLDLRWPDEAADSDGETIIGCLSPRLLALLRENPKLVEFLLEGA